MTYQTPAQSGGTLLEVKDLSMFYLTKSSCVRAVNEVTFTVHEGETFGLVGESGCGKSTAVRSLIRLLPEAGKIVSGTITYKGQDVTAMSEREVRRLRGREIGMIFQDPMTSLNPVSKVSKQFYESLKAEGLSRREMRERAIELLRLVDIPEPEQRLDNYVHEMSGGMRQRVMIARAMSSSHFLSISGGISIVKAYLSHSPRTKSIEHKNIGTSLMWWPGMSSCIAHRLTTVTHADRICVVQDGRIVESADTHGLLHDSRHPYTCGLINSLPAEHDTRTRLEPIHGAPPNLAQEIVGCPFAPRCPYATDVCRSVLPEMSEVAPGHQVRCHHADPTDRARMTEPTSSVTLQGGAA